MSTFSKTVYFQHDVPNGKVMLFENILFSPKLWIRLNTWTQYKHLQLTAVDMTIVSEAEITMYFMFISEQ